MLNLLRKTVGIFPREDSITVSSAVRLEQNDELQLQNHCMQIESIAALATPQSEQVQSLHIAA
jgi:hypothetical protein